MKKLLFLLLMLPLGVVAQDSLFVFTPEKFTDYVVVEVPGKSAAELYKTTIEWISKKYDSPDEVIKAKVENDYIRIEGASDDLVCFNMMGRSCYTSLYNVEISFKDGKYKMDITSIRFLGSSSDPNIQMNDMSEYFKKDGKVKGNYKFMVVDIPKYFNAINESLKQFLQNPAKKSDW